MSNGVRIRILFSNKIEYRWLSVDLSLKQCVRRSIKHLRVPDGYLTKKITAGDPFIFTTLITTKLTEH